MSLPVEQTFELYQIMQFRFSQEICEHVFGYLSAHMWEKWNNYERNIVRFLSSLDTGNRQRMFMWAMDEISRNSEE